MRQSLEECLKKTDSSNDFVKRTVEKMIAHQVDELYEFRIDGIMKELVRLKMLPTVGYFASELVTHCINPSKYSKYADNPEKANELIGYEE